MATLYRCTTPTDYLCPCGKIARRLRQEGIDFVALKVPLARDQRPEVEALTDQRRVPVLVIDGQAICDSHRITEYLSFREPTEPPAPKPEAPRASGPRRGAASRAPRRFR